MRDSIIRERYHKTKYTIIIAVLMAMLLLYAFSAAFYAKYLANLAGENFYLDVKANYRVIFDPTVGVINPEELTEDTWIFKSADKAVKLVENGSAYGELPTPSQANYMFLGWTTEFREHQYGVVGVPYIENTGKEYIDTGIVPKKEYEYGITISVPDDSHNENSYCVMGARSSAAGGRGVNIGTYNSDFYGERKPCALKAGTKYEMVLKNKVLTVTDPEGNRTELKYAAKDAEFTGYQLFIFALNSVGDPRYTKSGTRIYGAYVKDASGNYLFNMIPVCVEATENYGFYDTVSKKFFGNESGEGAFTGPEPEPLEYIQPKDVFDYAENTTFYADMCPYNTVSFDIGDGELLPETKIVLVGEPYGELPVPKKEGYNFTGWKSGDYYELDYIESTGYEYIDMHVIPKKEYEYGIDLSIADTSTDATSYCVLGARDGNSPSGVNIGTYNSDFYGERKACALLADEKYSMDLKDKVLTITDSQSQKTELVYTALGAEFDNRSLYVFALNNQGVIRPAAVGTKVYKTFVKDAEGKVLVDMVPAMRTADSVAGLYDKSSNSFFENDSNQGGFIPGEKEERTYLKEVDADTIVTSPVSHTLYAIWEPITYTVSYHYFSSGEEPVADDVLDLDIPFAHTTDLPNGYAELQYVQTDGNEYFDIDYIPNGNISIESEFELLSDETFALYGNKNAETDGGYRLFKLSINQLIHAVRGGAFENPNCTLTTGTRYHLIHNKNTFEINRINYSGGGAAGNNYYPMLLLRDAYTNGDRKPYIFNGRLYSFKIMEGTEVVKNYVPCCELTTSDVGLYETQDKVFYRNLGSKKLKKSTRTQVFTCRYNEIHSILTRDKVYNWSTDATPKGDIYASGEEVKNLCSNEGENLDLFALPTYTITFAGISETVTACIDNVMLSSYKAPVLEDAGFTFNGWESEDKVKYFDKDGNACIEMVEKDLLLLPILESEEPLYIRYDCIIADGNEYIDLNYTPNETTSIEAEFSLNSTETFGLYGNKNGATDGGYRSFEFTSNLYGSRGGAVNYKTFNLKTDTKYKLIHNATVYTIGAESYNGGASGNKFYPMVLLKDGYTDKDKTRLPYAFNGKLYSFSIYEGGKRVRHYVPCLDIIFKRVGLYDEDNDVFYPGLGTGKLQLGEIVPITASVTLVKNDETETHIKLMPKE